MIVVVQKNNVCSVSINSTSQREAVSSATVDEAKYYKMFPLIPLPRGKRSALFHAHCVYQPNVSINSTSQREAVKNGHGFYEVSGKMFPLIPLPRGKRSMIFETQRSSVQKFPLIPLPRGKRSIGIMVSLSFHTSGFH